MEISFSLKFIRKVFRVPGSVKLSWCILEEIDPYGLHSYRLGVRLDGYNKVIDVARRMFVEIGLRTPVHYQYHKAVKAYDGDTLVFKAWDGQPNSQLSDDIVVTVPKTYLEDIYFRCVYTEQLMYQHLI